MEIASNIIKALKLYESLSAFVPTTDPFAEFLIEKLMVMEMGAYHDGYVDRSHYISWVAEYEIHLWPVRLDISWRSSWVATVFRDDRYGVYQHHHTNEYRRLFSNLPEEDETLLRLML